MTDSIKAERSSTQNNPGYFFDFPPAQRTGFLTLEELFSAFVTAYLVNSFAVHDARVLLLREAEIAHHVRLGRGRSRESLITLVGQRKALFERHLIVVVIFVTGSFAQKVVFVIL